MNVIARTTHSDIATVFIAETGPDKYLEFVESCQPPLPREDKWVLIVSSLYGCPIGCRFCDAGHFYTGKISAEEIMRQIDYLVDLRYPDRIVPVSKFKIQFARMGEPALNPAVLDVLASLPGRYQAPGLLPTVSTMAPLGSDGFFRRLKEIKDDLYPRRFQLQLSVHSTEEARRDWLIPARKMPLDRIAALGREFFEPGDRKITLNFALSDDLILDPAALLRHFAPDLFFIKLTPVNPTGRAVQNRLCSDRTGVEMEPPIASDLREAGYDVLYSLGELEENKIGSNCGQHIMHYRNSSDRIEGSYSYGLQPVESDPIETRSRE